MGMLGENLRGLTTTVTVATGAETVTVALGMPAQEQALLYLATPEQALAYSGTPVGTTVTWRTLTPAPRLAAEPAVGPAVAVTFTNWVLCQAKCQYLFVLGLPISLNSPERADMQGVLLTRWPG